MDILLHSSYTCIYTYIYININKQIYYTQGTCAGKKIQTSKK